MNNANVLGVVDVIGQEGLRDYRMPNHASIKSARPPVHRRCTICGQDVDLDGGLLTHLNKHEATGTLPDSQRYTLDAVRRIKSDVVLTDHADSVMVAAIPVVVPTRSTPCESIHDRRLLRNGSSKKGSFVWAFSIAMPNGRCPFASSICSRWCYADVGKFPLNDHIYARNYEASKGTDFKDRLLNEVASLAWRNSGRQIAICAHEKGDFHSLTYLQTWGQVIRDTRHFSNLSYFIYTRSWVNPAFRTELDRIASECRNVRINLSLDREMVEQRGMPQRVGDGLLVYLCETDSDLPPPGVDIALRNLRVRGHVPLERIGRTLVCPNESGLYVAKENGLQVVKGAKTIPVRCMDCRICIDRRLQGWEPVKTRYAGTPKAPPDQTLNRVA